MFFDLNFVVYFFAESRFKKKADLSFTYSHDFLNDFVGKVMDNNFISIFPYQNELLLEVNSNQLSFTTQIKIFHRVSLGLSIKQRLSVVLENPPFDSMVRNAEILLRLAVFYDNLLKLFFCIGEGAYLFCSFFRTDLNLSFTDFTIVVAVNVCKEGNIHRSVVLFFQASIRVKFNQVACAFPVKVNFGVEINGLENGHLKPVLAALFKFRQVHIERIVLFLNSALVAKFPKIKYFLFSFVILGENRKIVLFCLHVLNHVRKSQSLRSDYFEILQRNYPEFVHAEHCDQFVAQGPQLGTEDVVFGQHLN